MPDLVDPILWNQIAAEIDADFGDGITKRILGERASVTLKQKNKTQFYLVPVDWLSFLQELDAQSFSFKSLGEWLGSLSEDDFRISIAVIEKLAELTESKVIVSERGAQAFTYGRSILKASVVKIAPYLQRGQKVIVETDNGICLGMAVLSVDASRVERLSEDDLVAKNILDIGWYVRKLG